MAACHGATLAEWCHVVVTKCCAAKMTAGNMSSDKLSVNHHRLCQRKVGLAASLVKGKLHGLMGEWKCKF